VFYVIEITEHCIPFSLRPQKFITSCFQKGESMTLRCPCLLSLLCILMAACSLESGTPTSAPGSNGNLPPGSELAEVIRVIDGDTIEVNIDGESYSVRYVGMNTPERDEVCYADATNANRALVENQFVRLERDQSDVDRYGRLLRYVYVGDTFVNAVLVREGWAEVVVYQPDDREFDNFRALEQAAASTNLGCHPTGIFDDGTYER
jgi:micrococcal nuclease